MNISSTQSCTWNRSCRVNRCRSAKSSIAPCDPLKLAAVVADRQTQVPVQARSRFTAVNVTDRPPNVGNTVRRFGGRLVAADDRAQRRDVDCRFQRVLCAPGRQARSPSFNRRPLTASARSAVSGIFRRSSNVRECSGRSRWRKSTGNGTMSPPARSKTSWARPGHPTKVPRHEAGGPVPRG